MAKLTEAALGISAATEIELPSATAAVTYGRPDTFVIMIDAMGSTAGIRQREAQPFVGRNIFSAD